MTKTDKTDLDDAGLELFFNAAREEDTAPSDGLMARILADAAAQADAREVAAVPQTPRPAPRLGLFGVIAAAIGGWPALASMATATVAGVWIGFATPDTLEDLAGGVLIPASSASQGYALEDLVPSYGEFAGLYEEG